MKQYTLASEFNIEGRSLVKAGNLVDFKLYYVKVKYTSTKRRGIIIDLHQYDECINLMYKT